MKPPPAVSESNTIADQLVAELAAEGEYVDDGGFDIDAVKGLHKLAQFQLADPRTYVLRLVEAGLIAGASAIHVDIRSDHLELRFERAEPIVIPPQVLERLVTVLVGRVPEHPGLPRAMLVQLAVGLIAALSMSPTGVTIDSVDARGDGRRVRFESTTGQHGEPIEGGRPGLRICVTGLGPQLHERELVESHCRWVRIPVIVDHRRISRQAVLADPVVRAPVELDGRVIGAAGFGRGQGPGELRLLTRGLLIAARRHPDFRDGFAANVEVDLRRDLSQAAFADEDEIERVLAAVLEVHDRLWTPELPKRLAAPVDEQAAALSYGLALAISVLFGITASFVGLFAISEFPLAGFFCMATGLGLLGVAFSTHQRNHK
jgi:hypothetical protein